MYAKLYDQIMPYVASKNRHHTWQMKKKRKHFRPSSKYKVNHTHDQNKKTKTKVNYVKQNTNPTRKNIHNQKEKNFKAKSYFPYV